MKNETKKALTFESISQVIEVLTEHNKWRRSEPPYEKLDTTRPPETKEVGKALDRACEYLEMLIKLSKSVDDSLRDLPVKTENENKNAFE